MKTFMKCIVNVWKTLCHFGLYYPFITAFILYRIYRKASKCNRFKQRIIERGANYGKRVGVKYGTYVWYKFYGKPLEEMLE